MKIRLIVLMACAALFACILPGAAFAQDDLSASTLQAASSELQVQETADPTCALITKNGWLNRCDGSGNAIENESTYWTAEQLGDVTKLFVSYSVKGLDDYTAVSDPDYTHPRVHLSDGTVSVSTRVALAGEPTESAPTVLTGLRTVFFLLNSNGVSKCETIADGLFAGSGLVRFDNLNKTSIVQIGDRAFAQCEKLHVNVNLPATCTTIGADAFAECTALKKVKFVKGLEKLEAHAFKGCAKLEEASLPNTIKSVGKQAFSDCTALANVSVNSDKVKVGVEAFSGCTSLATASLGSCSTVGDSAFSGCAALSSVSIASATTIGVSAFANCGKLATVSLGECGTIGASAFENCSALSTIPLGTVTAVDSLAFANCTALKSVNLSACTTVGTSAFANCAALSGAAMGLCKKVGASAFANCAALGGVSLPSVTAIGASAFEGCSSLKVMALGTKLKKLGSRAFAGTKIGKLELSEKVTSLPADLMGTAYVPLKRLILRSAKVVSLANNAVFANTPLGKAASKAGRIYVPKSTYKKYTKNKASNKWSPYRSKLIVMPAVANASVSTTNVTYNGSYQTPKVVVKYGKKTLRGGIDYEAVYSHNKDAGTGQVKIVGKDIYYGSKVATFTIYKAANTLTVQNGTRYVTDTIVKSKGMTIYGATGIDRAQGMTTFKKTKGSSAALAINATTGAVAIAKGTASGSYKLKVKVHAAGNNNYKPATKKFTLTVKVASKEEVAKHHSAATFISVALAEQKKWAAGKVPNDKYWSAFVSRHESWCSEFVGWCLREAGLAQGVTMPSNPSYARAYYNFYSAHPELATIHVNDGAYAPKPGDIILQIEGKTTNMVHTEMVTWCDGYNYGGVSGGSRVSLTSRNISNRSYYYFISIKWDVV